MNTVEARCAGCDSWDGPLCDYCVRWRNNRRDLPVSKPSPELQRARAHFRRVFEEVSLEIDCSRDTPVKALKGD